MKYVVSGDSTATRKVYLGLIKNVTSDSCVVNSDQP
jgi:hypothetical protein